MFVRPDTPPGAYVANVTVVIGSSPAQSRSLTVNVANFSLPSTSARYGFALLLVFCAFALTAVAAAVGLRCVALPTTYSARCCMRNSVLKASAVAFHPRVQIPNVVQLRVEKRSAGGIWCVRVSSPQRTIVQYELRWGARGGGLLLHWRCTVAVLVGAAGLFSAFVN